MKLSTLRMKLGRKGPEKAAAPIELDAPFVPSPVLIAAANRSKRLTRQATNASTYNPRLHVRAEQAHHQFRALLSYEKALHAKGLESAKEEATA